MRELAGLRVCFVAGTLGQGGSERQLYYLLRGLRQHGAEPRVLCLTKGEYWQEQIEALGIPVTWVGQSHSRVQRLRAIVRELRREPADVLQSQHFYTNIYVAAAGRMLGVPEVGAVRSNAIHELGANRGFLGRLSLIGPRTVAANSRMGIENAVALGLSRNRLRFLPNAVDTSQFDLVSESRSGPIRLLTVGRMIQPKRFDRFVRVVAGVRGRTSVRVHGVLVGDGLLRARLLEQAKELGLGSDALEFVGSEPDTIPHYRTADVLVLTSDWEGTPNVILEAMASGLPVVATRVGGVSDIVLDGRTGYLVDPWDENGLVDATVDLVENSERRRAYGRAGREFVMSHHAVSRIGFELKQLYDSVLGQVAQRSTVNGLPKESRFAAKRLLVVTHVVHYEHEGRILAHAPYAREIELWTRLFPRILIAAPRRIGPPPGDSLPIEAEDLQLAPQIDVRASSIAAKAVQLAFLPITLWRLASAMSRVDAVHVRCPGNIGLLGALLAPMVSRYRVAKYAGQWERYPGEPWTVRAQRAILRSRWWGAPVLVYGSTAGQRPHVVRSFTSILDATQMDRARKAATGRRLCGSGKLNVLYVGRLAPSKNVDVLVRSVATLEETGRPVTCTVVGGGSERRALERLAYDLGLVDVVRFVGAVPFERVLDFYESADVLVLPSSTEGWGKAIVEAMAFGVICVGPDCGVVPQLLADGRGFIVPPKSDDALTEVLARVFDESEKHAEMIARGAEWAQQYTLERFGDALSHVLTQHWNVPDEKPQVLPSYA